MCSCLALCLHKNNIPTSKSRFCLVLKEVKRGRSRHDSRIFIEGLSYHSLRPLLHFNNHMRWRAGSPKNLQPVEF